MLDGIQQTKGLRYRLSYIGKFIKIMSCWVARVKHGIRGIMRSFLTAFLFL